MRKLSGSLTNVRDKRQTSPKRLINRICEIPQQVENLLQRSLGTWTFNIFEVERLAGNNTLLYVGAYIFEYFRFVDSFEIPPLYAKNYLMAIERGCLEINKSLGFTTPNPYHNNIHTADVMATCFFFLIAYDYKDYLKPFDRFCLIMAALMHDYKHPGTTNEFEFQEKTDLAKDRNIEDCIEDYSAVEAFRLMCADEMDINRCFSREEIRTNFYFMTKSLIISTSANHSQMLMNEMGRFFNDPDVINKLPEKFIFLAWVLVSADVSNGGKVWPIHSQFGDRITEEFYRLGDYRKNRGEKNIPEYLDRQKNNKAQIELKFIEQICEPTLKYMGMMYDVCVGPAIPDFFKNARKGAHKQWEPLIKANKDFHRNSKSMK